VSDIPEGFEAVTDQLAFTEKGWKRSVRRDEWHDCAPNMTQVRPWRYIRPIQRKQVVYLAGPMRSIPYYNFPAFDAAEFAYLTAGYDVISPASLDRKAGFNAMTLPPDTDWSKIPDGFDFNACVERDIEAVKKCDIIYVLDGWEGSSGAKAELALAQWLGKQVIYHTVNPFEVKAETVKPTNPKDAIGSKKLPLHLWPTTATALGSLGMLNGALKYGRSNFRAMGVRSSIYYDAARRHIDAWFEGEECDTDDGVPHLAAALSCLAIIVDAQAAGKLNDDRMMDGKYREFVDSITSHVVRLKELHAKHDPKHWTIADGAVTPP
jgi:hypothetical protein